MIGLGVLLAWAGSWIFPSVVMAAPACDRAFALRQPDGTVVSARRGGDERFKLRTMQSQSFLLKSTQNHPG